jgi:abelson tyrosine-protein kinase 1
LVDDNLRCVISDFGQSEMKSEVYRISRTPAPRMYLHFGTAVPFDFESWTPLDGTLRWQAPELMSGSSPFSLTPQMDVYSYAILCIEILGMGRLPWPLMSDENVRHFVLSMTSLCLYHSMLITIFQMTMQDHPYLVRSLIPQACMASLPTFERIVHDVRSMRKSFPEDSSVIQLFNGAEPTPRTPVMSSLEWEVPGKASPDMRPRPISNPSTPRT